MREKIHKVIPEPPAAIVSHTKAILRSGLFLTKLNVILWAQKNSLWAYSVQPLFF
jgi:hypothetical protein